MSLKFGGRRSGRNFVEPLDATSSIGSYGRDPIHAVTSYGVGGKGGGSPLVSSAMWPNVVVDVRNAPISGYHGDVSNSSAFSVVKREERTHSSRSGKQMFESRYELLTAFSNVATHLYILVFYLIIVLTVLVK